MTILQPEAFSCALIDKAQKAARWNLLDSREVRFESDGRNGRPDYVPCNACGPLCVLCGATGRSSVTSASHFFGV